MAPGGYWRTRRPFPPLTRPNPFFRSGNSAIPEFCGTHARHAGRRCDLAAEHAKTNGQRPSRGDVKHAVLLALRTWPDGKTQREIAQQIGCSQTMVAYVKSQFSNIDKQAIPATVTGKDGNTLAGIVGVMR